MRIGVLMSSKHAVDIQCRKALLTTIRLLNGIHRFEEIVVLIPLDIALFFPDLCGIIHQLVLTKVVICCASPDADELDQKSK